MGIWEADTEKKECYTTNGNENGLRPHKHGSVFKKYFKIHTMPSQKKKIEFM